MGLYTNFKFTTCQKKNKTHKKTAKPKRNIFEPTKNQENISNNQPTERRTFFESRKKNLNSWSAPLQVAINLWLIDESWSLSRIELERPYTLNKAGNCWGLTRVFPKIGVPQNEWFIMEHLIKMDDLGVPPFLETSTNTLNLPKFHQRVYP